MLSWHHIHSLWGTPVHRWQEVNASAGTVTSRYLQVQLCSMPSVAYPAALAGCSSVSAVQTVQLSTSVCSPKLHTHHHHNRFTALFPGPPGWAGNRRELLDFMVQGEINRGRHTGHPTGRHFIRTNHCPPPPSPHIFYGPDTLPAT